MGLRVPPSVSCLSPEEARQPALELGDLMLDPRPPCCAASELLTDSRSFF